nr:Hypothetical protein FSTVLC9_101 [Faustovirus]
MNMMLIIGAVVLLIVLIGVLYAVNKANQPPATTPPVTTTPPPTTTTPPITTTPPPITSTDPVYTDTGPVTSTPPADTTTAPPLPTQSPLTPDRWASYYNPANPAQWLVLRKNGDTTQCYAANNTITSPCFALPTKKDADGIASAAIVQDMLKIKQGLPANYPLYPVINCNDQLRQDPASWCHMFD